MRHSSKSISFIVIIGLKRRKQNEIQSLTVQRKDKIVMIMKTKKKKQKKRNVVFLRFLITPTREIEGKEMTRILKAISC